MRASVADAEPPPLVLIVCGRCGAGKSATCNTLLGRHQFASRRSATAVTHDCLSAEMVLDGQRRLIILDTPGLSDPEASEADIHACIISGAAALSDAHPSARFAVGLVVSLAGRIDLSVLEDFSRLGLVFGRNLYEHSVLLWTHGDLLVEGAEQSIGIEQSGPHCSGSENTAAMDAAFAAYLDDAGEDVTAWLAKVKGGSLVLRNREKQPPAASSDVHDTVRAVIDRAATVAGRASQLAPPKPHRKAARRERQQALRKAVAREERYAADGKLDSEASPPADGRGGWGLADLSWSAFLDWFTKATSVLSGATTAPRQRQPRREPTEGSGLLERESRSQPCGAVHPRNTGASSLPPV